MRLLERDRTLFFGTPRTLTLIMSLVHCCLCAEILKTPPKRRTRKWHLSNAAEIPWQAEQVDENSRIRTTPMSVPTSLTSLVGAALARLLRSRRRIRRRCPSRCRAGLDDSCLPGRRPPPAAARHVVENGEPLHCLSAPKC